MNPLKSLVLLFAISLFAFHAEGQTDSFPVTEFEPVIVRARYLPNTLDTTAIKHMQTRNLSDLLGRSSAIFVKNYGPSNISAITVRGLSASQTRITWNGMELNSPMYGMADLSLVPAAVFKRAEIASEGGIGGNVNLFTDPDYLYPAGLSFSALQSIESFDTRYSQLSAGYGSRYLPKGEFTKAYGGSTRVYYRTAENDFSFINNARFGLPVENLSHASTEMYGLVQEINRTVFGQNDLKAAVWAQHNFRQLPPPLTSANNKETQKDNSIRAVVRYEKRHLLGESYINGSFNGEELIYDNKTIGIHSPGRSMSVALSGGRRGIHRKYGSYTAELRTQYTRAIVGRYYSPKEQNQIQANFEIINFKERGWWVGFNPQLVNFTHFMPNSYLRFRRFYSGRPVSSLEILARLNYKYPSLNDLYWVPGGNDSLKPEKALSQEMTVQSNYLSFLKRGEAFLKLTAYSIYAFDFIQWQPADGAYWQAQNLNEVWSRGIEASVKFQKPVLRGLMTWNNSYNYTRVSTQKPINPTDKSVGRQLIYVPRFTAQSSLQYERKKFFAGAYYTYTDYRRTPDGYLPPYQLIDLDMGVEKKFQETELGLSFRVNNIFNESYQVIIWRPMPGRWYSLTMNLTWTKKKEQP
jgi:iron complex outermembrane receptor protein